MDTPQVVGLSPWWPWPLSRWRWLAAPVRAERLAALRIGLALVLLIDVLTTYLPNATVFFGTDSFADRGAFDWYITPPKSLRERDWDQLPEDWEHPPKKFNWSLLWRKDEPYPPQVIYLAMAVWVVALVGLVTGFCTRLNAVVVWVISTSFASTNTNIDNAGDLVRGIILFYLMLCPCGAAWSVDAWLKKRVGPVFVSPWALRLLFLQMVFIYWCNGLHKITGGDWQSGQALYFVLGDLTLARFSYASIPGPSWLVFELTRLGTWFVLMWEVTLPLLLIWRPVRNVALVFGALFHLGIWATMEIGFFPPYMLCLYLPLLPWEKLADRWLQPKAAAVPAPLSPQGRGAGGEGTERPQTTPPSPPAPLPQEERGEKKTSVK
jgi:Vitamin K-dependent gamma-carboxylase